METKKNKQDSNMASGCPGIFLVEKNGNDENGAVITKNQQKNPTDIKTNTRRKW
jgi:hypothetical protein